MYIIGKVSSLPAPSLQTQSQSSLQSLKYSEQKFEQGQFL